MKIFIFFTIITAFPIWLIADQKPVKAGVLQCARMYSQQFREFVVNSCNTCRRVAVQRRRVGLYSAPIMRTYDLQAKTKFPLPFKGPGRSKITSDVPCRDQAGGGQSILRPAQTQPLDQPKNCVSSHRSRNFGLTLINDCKECRAVALGSYSLSGKLNGRRFYKLKPHKRIHIRSNRNSRVHYLKDFPCPS